MAAEGPQIFLPGKYTWGRSLIIIVPQQRRLILPLSEGAHRIGPLKMDLHCKVGEPSNTRPRLVDFMSFIRI